MGDEVRVEAVLVDPVLDIMIGSLTDPTRTRREPFKLPDGRELMNAPSLVLRPQRGHHACERGKSSRRA